MTIVYVAILQFLNRQTFFQPERKSNTIFGKKVTFSGSEIEHL